MDLQPLLLVDLLLVRTEKHAFACFSVSSDPDCRRCLGTGCVQCAAVRQ
jgi:hypothetical protein